MGLDDVCIGDRRQALVYNQVGVTLRSCLCLADAWLRTSAPGVEGKLWSPKVACSHDHGHRLIAIVVTEGIEACIQASVPSWTKLHGVRTGTSNLPAVRTGAATVQERIQQLRGAGEHSVWKSQQQGFSDARVRLQGHFERVTGSQCRRATAQALLARLEKETSNL